MGQINVTGLGLPSEMAGHVKAGASKSFAIWNPIDLGYSATMIAYDLATKKARPSRAPRSRWAAWARSSSTTTTKARWPIRSSMTPRTSSEFAKIF